MISMSKKALSLVAVPVIATLAGTGAILVNNSQRTGATDVPPIVQQVENNTNELANHEARIANSENDIKSLQASTNTAPSTTKVAVPAATPTPVVAAVTVTAYEKITIDTINIDCKYTYSDGTTYQWHWQKAGPDAWITDGSGLNGHWAPTTQATGDCDNSAAGRVKGT